MIEVTKYLIILGVLCVSNILLGIYNSVNVEDVKFDVHKLLNGIVKALIVAFSCYGLTYAFCEMPELADALGAEPRLIMISAIVAYASKVITKVTKVLGVKANVKEKEEEES